MIVLDASVLVPLIVPQSNSNSAHAIWSRGTNRAVPVLWRFEVAHAVGRAVRSAIIDYAQAADSIRVLEAALAPVEKLVPTDEILEVVFRTGLSAYDASYVALAQKLGCQVLTWDEGIIQKAPGVAMRVEDWLAAKGR